MKTLIATLFLVENQPVDIKVDCDLIRSMLLLLQYKNVDSLNKFQFMKYSHYLRNYQILSVTNFNPGTELTIDAINPGSQYYWCHEAVIWKHYVPTSHLYIKDVPNEKFTR